VGQVPVAYDGKKIAEQVSFNPGVKQIKDWWMMRMVREKICIQWHAPALVK